jgi:hypothetical protein
MLICLEGTHAFILVDFEHFRACGRWAVLGEEVGSRCRDYGDAQLLEHVMSGQLHGEVAGEAIRRLNEDCLCTVVASRWSISLKPGRWSMQSAPLRPYRNTRQRW